MKKKLYVQGRTFLEECERFSVVYCYTLAEDNKTLTNEFGITKQKAIEIIAFLKEFYGI